MNGVNECQAVCICFLNPRTSRKAVAFSASKLGITLNEPSVSSTTASISSMQH